MAVNIHNDKYYRGHVDGGGDGMLGGRVYTVVNGQNVPLVRVVTVRKSATKVYIDSTLSNTDGSWSIVGLDRNMPFDVVCHDTNGVLLADIVDNIYPGLI